MTIAWDHFDTFGGNFDFDTFEIDTFERVIVDRLGTSINMTLYYLTKS